MKIKKIDETQPDPLYASESAAGLDLFVGESVDIAPGEYTFVSMNVVVALPGNTVGMLLPRSSLFKKKGLMLANSLGVIDEDYCGEGDVIMACLYNPTDEMATLEEGERLCQLVVMPVVRPEPHFVGTMENKNRGGFGSTD